jgi:STE24 endopeptidase
MNDFAQLVLILFVANTAVSLILDWLNHQYVVKHQNAVPTAFSDMIDLHTYQKSTQYSLAKLRFSAVTTIYDCALTIIVLFSGVLPWTWNLLISAFGLSLWGQTCAFLILFFVLQIFHLPFEWWMQFRLEERFGFNKSSLKLWITDKIKYSILTFALGFVLLSLLLLFFRQFPKTWWIIGFVLIFGFQLLMMVLYPKLILPLFNKLTPLENGELKNRLMALAEHTGFKAQTIDVIDGSKRSGHSNAYFTGFGKFRRIVLFDTLINQLSIDELEAVLAHEIGHYKCGHVPKMLIMSGAIMFSGFGLLHILSSWPTFFTSFGLENTIGFSETHMTLALILFFLIIPTLFFWVSPFVALWTRKHEYEADEFAHNACRSSNPLIRALHKLHTKNLSNLTPHPWYSAFHYSHPTLIEREAALKQLDSE